MAAAGSTTPTITWDRAYDSAELREDLHERGNKPVIPNHCNRKQPFSFSKRLYKCAGASRAHSTG